MHYLFANIVSKLSESTYKLHLSIQIYLPGKAITKLSRKEVDIEEKNTDHTSGCSDEETSDKEVTDKHLTSIARGQVNPDWDIFGDGEPGSLDMNVMDMGNMKQV